LRSATGTSTGKYAHEGARFKEYKSVVLEEVPDSLLFEEAAMAEPLSIALHAAGTLENEQRGAAIVVTAGVIGLLAVQLLRSRGFKVILAP
jgi:L-iditol 2-dehydrogenase